MRLIIAGGGTGGHLFPGIALAEELTRRGEQHQVLFVGARGGMEERAVPRCGYKVELMPSLKGGLIGWDVAGKTVRLCKGYLQARRTLLDFKADAVVGLGGYASALPVLASWGVEVPSLILEQNMIPGRTTRKLARFADRVGVQFPESIATLGGPRRAIEVGNPLRRRIVEAAETAAPRNLEERPALEDPTLLVLGGSHGARFLNDLVMRIWPKMKKALPGVQILLVSGRHDEERAADAFAGAGVRGRVVAFCENMEELYAQADLVLARAGATSLAEISAFALPSILVPYPHAADNHQRANAQVYVKAGASWMMEERALSHDRLVQRLADIALQPSRRLKMAMHAWQRARLHAASTVVDRLEELAGLRKPAAPIAGPPQPPSGPAGPEALHAGVA